MKLDKLKFAEVIGYCANRGMTVDATDIKVLDDLINTSANADDINNMIKAIKDGRKIDAIKYYRTITGMWLKDSKDAIEAHWPIKRSLNERDELYIMLKEGRASADCQKDAAEWIKKLYNDDVDSITTLDDMLRQATGGK